MHVEIAIRTTNGNNNKWGIIKVTFKIGFTCIVAAKIANFKWKLINNS